MLDLAKLVDAIASNTVYEQAVRAYAPEDVAVLANIHCLPSTVSLIRALIQFGVPAQAIVVIPKPYSTVSSAEAQVQEFGVHVVRGTLPGPPGFYDRDVHRMLDSGCQYMASILTKSRARRLILLDDGGLLSANWHRDCSSVIGDVISIQQTASGMARWPYESPMPKLDVARCAAKRIFESWIVSSGVIRKLETLKLIGEHHTVGVVGAGTLGTRLTEHLLPLVGRVLTYDKIKSREVFGADRCRSAPELLRNATLIFGCTGKNWLRGDRLMQATTQRHFVSCSSRAVEFQTLLQSSKIIAGQVPFGRLIVETKGGTRHVVENGGFPLNFDRSHEWETGQEILLTRALILLSFCQSLTLTRRRERAQVLTLTPAGQQQLVKAWLDDMGRKCTDFGVSELDFRSVRWWQKNSEESERFFLTRSVI
jgi:hypothetical protein